jgi:hypothetical protein
VTDRALPLSDFHHPATFASRGVAVPFTTPKLAGVRVRGSGRTRIELVVPNPSGGRGIYILNWPGVRALCNPTLYDTMLFRRFARLVAIDPACVRDIALDVALAGYAGRGASAAAETTIVHDGSQRRLTYSLLLTGWVVQADPNGDDTASSPEQIEQRASTVLQRIALALGRPAAQLVDGLATIADLFAAVGFSASDHDARIPRLLLRLSETQADLSRWLETDPDNDIGGLGQAVAVGMRRACDTGKMVLATTRQALTDPIALLKRWIADEASVQALAMRCDWLLDGWERVALLWLSANPRAPRRAALLEMAPLLPVLPREVRTWTSPVISAEAMEQAFRVTSREDAWRTGSSAHGLIERNEKLLAMGV